MIEQRKLSEIVTDIVWESDNVSNLNSLHDTVHRLVVEAYLKGFLAASLADTNEEVPVE